MSAPHYQPAWLAATTVASPGRSLSRGLRLIVKRLLRLALENECTASPESARGILIAILDGADRDAPRLYTPGRVKPLGKSLV